MTKPRKASTPTLAHIAFFAALRDSAEGSDQWNELSAAVLSLRLADEWWRSGPSVVDPEAMSARAARLAIGQLPADGDVRNVLLGLVNLMQSHRWPDVALLTPRLLALAQLYRTRGAYVLAADVFATAVELGDEDRSGDILTDAQLGRGFCLRESGSLRQASECYVQAGQISRWRRDVRRLLLSRIGLANVVRYEGDLPRADEMFDAVVRAAERAGERRVQSFALQDQAIVCLARNDLARAVSLSYAAFNLSESDRQRETIAGNIGAYLVKMGRLDSAHDALVVQEAIAIDTENIVRARINLLSVAARAEDRDAFVFYRALLSDAPMVPSHRADFLIESARGFIAFDGIGLARAALAEANEIAIRHGFNRTAFEVDELLAETTRAKSDRAPAEVPGPVAHVEAALRLLAGAIDAAA